jgi:hypothetical protein
MAPAVARSTLRHGSGCRTFGVHLSDTDIFPHLPELVFFAEEGAAIIGACSLSAIVATHITRHPRKASVVLTRFLQILRRRILTRSLVIPVELGVVAFEFLKHLVALLGKNGYRWHC